ncbi:hypothetical protein AWZ03_011038 [Drosophila navojoa]|uniref:Uncharacterized protein n=1 Tax=Drosophila navojoa TaxID=7232 RepID=A0A484B1H2_DRONA|nr:hypothetical protein AWZ03_011038 [Drosophila navojoa]
MQRPQRVEDWAESTPDQAGASSPLSTEPGQKDGGLRSARDSENGFDVLSSSNCPAAAAAAAADYVDGDDAIASRDSRNYFRHKSANVATTLHSARSVPPRGCLRWCCCFGSA